MRFLQKKPIIRTGYISEIDKFLRQFDENRPVGHSRLKETEKHRKIFEKRDFSR